MNSHCLTGLCSLRQQKAKKISKSDGRHIDIVSSFCLPIQASTALMSTFCLRLSSNSKKVSSSWGCMISSMDFVGWSQAIYFRDNSDTAPPSPSIQDELFLIQCVLEKWCCVWAEKSMKRTCNLDTSMRISFCLPWGALFGQYWVIAYQTCKDLC